MRKIALTGRMRAGKDVVARHLWLEHDFEGIAFADAMKRIFHDICPWIAREPKPRAEYQRFGEEMRRLYGEDIWIKHVEARVKGIELYSRTPGVVITDLRLPIEYEWCKRNGFEIVRVSASDTVRLERARRAGDDFNEADFEHDTERYVDSFEVDAEIVNDGTLADLERKIDEIMA